MFLDKNLGSHGPPAHLFISKVGNVASSYRFPCHMSECQGRKKFSQQSLISRDTTSWRKTLENLREVYSHSRWVRFSRSRRRHKAIRRPAPEKGVTDLVFFTTKALHHFNWISIARQYTRPSLVIAVNDQWPLAFGTPHCTRWTESSLSGRLVDRQLEFPFPFAGPHIPVEEGFISSSSTLRTNVITFSSV